MKTICLFHDIWTHYPKADWLAAHYPIDSFVVVKKTRAWWGKYLWSRLRRRGLRKVLDEVSFRVYWLLFKSASDYAKIGRLMESLKHDLPSDYKRPPVYRVNDINSSESEAVLRALAPDVCVLTVHPILKERIFSIARCGMLVFHPGLTPEYRGPHPAFWATLNNEFWGIGWSLLQINHGIDTGPVLAQGSAKRVDPLTQSHIYMQHISHVEGLPHVVRVLRKLGAGEQPRVLVDGRASTNYTHPGISDYMKLRRVLRGLRANRPSSLKKTS